MIRNRDLISKAKVFARNCGRDDSERVDSLIDSYETACILPLGPDASRSKVWEGKANERRAALCKAIHFQE